MGETEETPKESKQAATTPRKTITIKQRSPAERRSMEMLKEKMLAQFYKNNPPSISARLSTKADSRPIQIPDIVKKRMK